MKHKIKYKQYDVEALIVGGGSGAYEIQISQGEGNDQHLVLISSTQARSFAKTINNLAKVIEDLEVNNG